MVRNIFFYTLFFISTIVIARIKPGYISTMLFFIAVMIPLVELLTLIYTYTFFQVSHEVDKRSLIKGESVNYKMQLHNRTPFVFCPMTIHYSGSQLLFAQSHLNEKEAIVLYPYKKKMIQQEIRCLYRGSYYLGVESIQIRGFFNLFSLSYKSLETHRILVYPLIHELKQPIFKHALSDASESILEFDRFDRSIFSELRSYQPGDNLNKIHWKLSSRLGELITKEYEGNVNNQTKVIINNKALELDEEKSILIEDAIIEGVVPLTKNLLDSHTPTTLLWHRFEEIKVSGNHHQHFSRFYEALAKIVFEKRTFDFLDILAQETDSTQSPCVLMLFLTEVDEATAQFLIQKKRQGYEINIFILDDKKFDFEYMSKSSNRAPLYSLMSSGIAVFKFIFEDNTCRLEVA